LFKIKKGGFMTVEVSIPFLFERYIKNKKMIESEAGTLSEILGSIVLKYPGIKNKIFSDGNSLKSNINIFINNKIIEDKSNLNIKVKDRDKILLLVTIAGG